MELKLYHELGKHFLKETIDLSDKSRQGVESLNHPSARKIIQLTR